MKKYSKLLALLMALAMIFALAACSNTSSETSTPPSEEVESQEPGDEPSTEPADDGETYTIGIIQQMQHAALDAATQGFEDALTELLGDAVTFDL